MLNRVSISLRGALAYERAFEMTAREASDLTAPLEAVGKVLVEAVGKQFESEGSFGGTPWKPLNPAYAQWKEAHYPGRPLMVRTAELRQAMLDESSAVHVYPHLLVYEPQGTGSDGRDLGAIALYQDEGKGRLPARHLVELPGQTRREIDRVFAEWLTYLRRGILSHAA